MYTQMVDEEGLKLQKLQAENAKVRSSISWGLYVASYSIVLNRMVSMVDLRLNSTSSTAEVSESFTPPPENVKQNEVQAVDSMLNSPSSTTEVSENFTQPPEIKSPKQEVAVQDQSWASWGWSAVSSAASTVSSAVVTAATYSTAAVVRTVASTTNAGKDLVDAWDGVSIAQDIIYDQKRREEFLSDPATIEFLKDQKQVPHTFFKALKEGGVIDKLVTSHEEGTALNITGKLLQDENLTTQFFDLFDALDTEEIKSFVDMYYAKDRVHITSQILQNQKLQTQVKAICGALSQRAPELIEFAKLFLTEEQQKALNNAQSPEMLKELLMSMEKLDPSYFESIARIISSRPIEKILKANKEDRASVAAEELPKFLDLVRADPQIKKDLKNLFLQNTDLINKYLPDNLRVYFKENPTTELLDILLEDKNLALFQKIMQDVMQGPDQDGNIASKILESSTPDICDFIDRNQEFVVKAALQSQSLGINEPLMPEASKALSVIVRSVVRSESLKDLVKDIDGLQKSKDPKEIEAHSSSMTQNLLKLLPKIDFSELKDIYKDPKKLEAKKQVTKVVQNFCDSWGLNIDGEKLTKFLIENQKNIEAYLDNKDKKGFIAKVKSFKSLTLIIAKNPKLMKNLFSKNKHVYLSYTKPEYKTKELESWLKDAINVSRENKQEFGSCAVKLGQEKYPENKLVKFYAGNFSGLDLTSMIFSNEFDFSGTKIDRVFFNGSKMSCNFADAEIGSCSFAKCELSDVSFEGATLTNVSFKDAKLSEKTIASLEKATMDEVSKKSFEEARQSFLSLQSQAKKPRTFSEKYLKSKVDRKAEPQSMSLS